jgi:hypothetical protein
MNNEGFGVDRSKIDEDFGIDRSKIYRRNSPETRAIIGLRATAVDAAILRGDLPPLLDLTEGGRARGWLGQQLVDLQKQRLAKALDKKAKAQRD